MKANLEGVHGQKTGAIFESIFKFQCERVGVACTRIPDGCRQTYVRGRLSLIRVKTPCDWFISDPEGRSAIIDTKTTQNGTFPVSAIEPHQVYEMARHKGIANGYIVWTRKNDQVLFIPSRILLERMSGRVTQVSPDSLLGTSSSFDIRMIFAQTKINGDLP